MKMKMKMISDLGIRNAEIENRKRPEGGAFFLPQRRRDAEGVSEEIADRS